MTVGVVAVGALFHLGMVFLHVAPSNTLSKQHASAVSDYVYPEFEQNWKLFAPDPLQQNIHVQARAEVRKPDGGTETTGWVDMTAMDVADMRHNLLPSHSQQNELRRAWGYYTDTHNDQNQPTSGNGSDLSSTYLSNILAERLGPRLNGGAVVRIQARAATTTVARPSWSGESVDTTTQYRELPWWIVPTAPAGQENAS
ncbi:DUF5819 family protein [Streptomyces cocklensis]|uniref:DUF5819 family protein n=1 Tax=Actinacidiphila cocklensis TaxID=887465 RepID=UPI00203BA3EA|nr:DUF5819 family protein [Actinacidiphila cocklensis]MDD1056927.1 DUF5819 family protein [Actinacidiphila cocklensis]WSX78069.1 DUF5819 family protein [Streptomyces sp. NBC_00899]